MVNNTAIGCRISNIFLVGSKGNDIISNRAEDGGRCGIVLVFSDENMISGNDVFGNPLMGISLYSSNANAIIFNRLEENGLAGINLNSSNNNTLYGNTLYGNMLYGNMLYGNTSSLGAQLMAFDDRSNHWGLEEHPNRYSDFDEPSEGCVDKRHPGICDREYPIPGSGNVDRYPVALSQR